MARSLARALPALALIVVAAAHLVAVRVAGVSSWRGGGMGMYADFHPERTRIVAYRDGVPVSVERCEDARWRATRMTSGVEQVRACEDADEVVAYRPHFDPVRLRWQLVEVARAER